MMNYIITFFILAVVAGFLGFGGLAMDFAAIAKLLSLVFVIMVIGGIVYSLISGRRANTRL